MAETFGRVDWFVPPYFSNRALSALHLQIETAGESGPAALEAGLRQLYGPAHQAAMLYVRYPRIPAIRKYCPQLREAMEASAMGLDRAAVSTVLPVVEGAIREVAKAGERDLGSGTRRLVSELDLMAQAQRAAIVNEPGIEALHERAEMIEQLRDFMKSRLLQQTAKYEGTDQLNRHGILHGLFTEFGTRTNFHRLLSFLDGLAFAISLSMSGVSLFGPTSSETSQNFASYLRALTVARRARPDFPDPD